MCRRLSFLVCVVLVLGLVKGALADITWTNADANDNLWRTPGNWDLNRIPIETGEGDNVWLADPSVEGPLIDAATTANAMRLRGPGYENPPGSDLTITGGTLTFNRYWRLGFGAGVGTVHMSGGTVHNKCNYPIRMNNGSTFNLSDGLVNSGFFIPNDQITGTAVATLNMTGGTIDAKADVSRGIWIGVHDTGPGVVNLHGGTIITETFMLVDGLMDITEGTLIVDNDVTLTIEAYVNDALITAYGGIGLVVYSYDDVNNVTVVTAVESSPVAYFPRPATGATGVCPDVVLEWRAGDYAVWHDVYLGTDFNDVNDATTTDTLDVYMGRQAVEDTDYAAEELLDWGITYYWRIDEVNDACEPYLWKGRVWNFTIGSGKAENPSPADSDWRIPVDSNLAWQAGCLADWHDVYLGTDFNDVNSATDPNAPPGRGRQAACSYDPAGLAYDATYYWRIDQVGDSMFIRGDVWSFTTVNAGQTLLMCDISAAQEAVKEGWSLLTKYEGYPQPDAGSYGSEDGALTWQDMNSPDGTPTGIDITLDVGESGRMEGRTYTGEPLGMDFFFGGGGGSPDGDFIIKLGGLLPGTYRLTSFHNNTWYAIKPGPIGQVAITGGVTYSEILTPLPIEQSRQVYDISVCQVQVEFDATGAEEATIRYKPVSGGVLLNGFILDYFSPDKRYAHWPVPRDGAKDVPLDAVLRWYQGLYAADPLAHDVYLGTDFDDVNNASRTVTLGVYKGSQSLDANMYDPPGFLDLETTYYWRIDERNDANGNLWKGNVWEFTVADHIVIDDMESYDKSGNWIYDTWDDGYANNSGSELDLGIGTGEYANPVHGGEKSMMYLYDNADPRGWGFDYYAEASLAITDPCDWTGPGTKILTLFFYGDQDNDANATEQMYAGLQDSRGSDSFAQVDYGYYPDEDMNDIREEEWHQWDIALPDFTGVMLTDVEKLCIGFGIRGNLNPGGTPGGSGIVYFDDIRLYLPKCVPWRLKPFGDFTDDCKVDLADVGEMADEWLRTDSVFDEYTNPGDANLVGWWKLDENDGNTAADSSIYGNSGTAEGGYSWVVGHDNVSSALRFSDDGRVLVPDDGNTPELRPLTTVSTSAWIYFSTSQNAARVVVKGADNREAYELEVSGDDKLIFQVRKNDPCVTGSLERFEVSSEALAPNEWIHIAGTFDGDSNTLSCYINGELLDSKDDVNFVSAGGILSQDADGLAIGNRSDDDNRVFEGTIDDVRVYNRALSAAEIAWLASDGTGYVPLLSMVNIYDEEPVGEKVVNFRDLAKLMNNWREEELKWPE